MGNEVSLIILGISQNFQNGGGGHFGFWKNSCRKFFNPDIPTICALTEHKSVIVLLLTIIILQGTGGPGLVSVRSMA